MLKRLCAVGVGVLLLSACAPQETPLPTLVGLPSVSPVGVVMATAGGPLGEAIGRATLPATLTPTPSVTGLPSATPTNTITVTASATITETPTVTATPLPTLPPEERAVTGLLELALQATLLPTNYIVPNFVGAEVPIPSPSPMVGTVPIQIIAINSTPASAVTPPTCSYYPPGGFGAIYTTQPDLANALGCPAGNPPDVLSLQSAWQPYQNGFLLWINGEIYALYSATTSYQFFVDTFVEGTDPTTGTESPPFGLVAPVRGFNKVWSNNPTVKSTLGWATQAEVGTTASVLKFQNGMMIAFQGRSDVFVLVGSTTSGSWRSVFGGF